MICRDCLALYCPYRKTDATAQCAYETNNEPGKLIYMPGESFDIVSFRCYAAKDFLAASIQRYGFEGDPKDDSGINRAIQYADELIKQLNLLLPQ